MQYGITDGDGILLLDQQEVFVQKVKIPRWHYTVLW